MQTQDQYVDGEDELNAAVSKIEGDHNHGIRDEYVDDADGEVEGDE